MMIMVVTMAIKKKIIKKPKNNICTEKNNHRNKN